MAGITELYEFLSELAPTELAAKWDNVGVLLNAGVEPTGVLFALDITPEVITEAAALNCHLIVSHHPVIFKPLKRIDMKDVAYQLIAKKISAICMHTNLDAADGGVNDVLAELFELRDVVKFAEDCGRIGTIEPTTINALSDTCTRLLGADVQFVDVQKPITKVAVVGGAGGSFVTEAIEKGADVLITGEASHHDALDAKRCGLHLIVAGHHATEFPIVPVLATGVQAAFPSIKCYVSEVDADPYTRLLHNDVSDELTEFVFVEE